MKQKKDVFLHRCACKCMYVKLSKDSIPGSWYTQKRDSRYNMADFTSYEKDRKIAFSFLYILFSHKHTLDYIDIKYNCLDYVHYLQNMYLHNVGIALSL